MAWPPFSHAARVSIAVGTGLSFANAVSTVFVSMYLYRWLDSIALLTVFNLGQFALMPLGFALAALVARRFGNRSSMALGLALFVAFYGLLVALGETSSRHLVALGVVNGLANGLFWFPFNIVTARAADESDKGRFFGVSGALGSAAMAAGPLASTLAISLAPLPEIGYSILFLSIVAVMAAMTVVALSLPNDASRAPIEIGRRLRARGDGRWAFALKASFVYGLRDGANWSVMSILILQGAGSETIAGYLAIAFAVLGIGANYLVGKSLTPRRYSSLWGWGSLAATVSALVIALWPNFAGAAVSGSLWKAAEALVLMPFNAAFLGVLASYLKKEGGIAGRNIAAEIALNAGRALGALSFLVLSFFTADYARILFPVLTLAVPATWLIYRRHAADIARGAA
jgi:MFS transporter, YQGE family, putative transporter